MNSLSIPTLILLAAIAGGVQRTPPASPPHSEPAITVSRQELFFVGLIARAARSRKESHSREGNLDFCVFQLIVDGVSG